MKLFRESVLQLPHIYVNFMLLRRDAYSTKPIRISMKNKETKRSVTNNSYMFFLCAFWHIITYSFLLRKKNKSLTRLRQVQIFHCCTDKPQNSGTGEQRAFNRRPKLHETLGTGDTILRSNIHKQKPHSALKAQLS